MLTLGSCLDWALRLACSFTLRHDSQKSAAPAMEAMALCLLVWDALMQRAPAQVGNAPLPNVTQVLGGLVTAVDPIAFADTSAKIRASGVGGVIAATGALRCAVLPRTCPGNASMNHAQCEPCRPLLRSMGLGSGAHSDAPASLRVRRHRLQPLRGRLGAPGSAAGGRGHRDPAAAHHCRAIRGSAGRCGCALRSCSSRPHLPDCTTV